MSSFGVSERSLHFRRLQPTLPDLEGDLLFLLDSSGSVSYYEFSRIKEFIAELLLPFTFGPHDVQTGIVHISTTPILEFPFDRHFSTGAIQHAIRNIQQVMGDTNTGQTISFAKEKLFTAEAGARPNVPKVLVWVTDGFSKDDVAQPMQLLKDMGVTVFIVSTGRGNYLELSAAASQPPEKHLHFVDRLRATDVTASSFRLTWPQLLTRDTGYYVLEYAPSGEPRRKVTKQLTGDHTSLVVAQLASQTDYEVVLIPESNEKYIPPQTTRVTTLEDVVSPAQILISESKPHSIRVSWSPILETVAAYQVMYGPLNDNLVQLQEVDGSLNSTVLEKLLSNTSYLVTHLHFEDLSPSSVKASWDPAEGDVLGYRVRCRRQAGSSTLLSVSPQIHSVLLSDLTPGSNNKVCVKPVYRARPGKGLCRMIHRQPASAAGGYRHQQRV
ncbi:putative von Willebrand factor A domain-containing protein [Naja naja]|nr:putative von Willebrand factor A domain-containing protein [Naja naja]